MSKPVSPVVPGLEPFEITYMGKGCLDLPVLRGRGPAYEVYSRWELTAEERLCIADGADVYVVQQTMGNRLQPQRIVIAKASVEGSTADEIRDSLGLNDELDERLNQSL